jgi:hypothetical protein
MTDTGQPTHDRTNYRHNSDNSTSTEAINSRSSTTARISDRRRSGGRNPFTGRHMQVLPTGHHEVPGGLEDGQKARSSGPLRGGDWLMDDWDRKRRGGRGDILKVEGDGRHDGREEVEFECRSMIAGRSMIAARAQERAGCDRMTGSGNTEGV